MKRVKLISIILAVSVLLCSCSDKAARRNDEEAVEETEAEVQTIPLTSFPEMTLLYLTQKAAQAPRMSSSFKIRL